MAVKKMKLAISRKALSRNRSKIAAIRAARARRNHQQVQKENTGALDTKSL